MSHAKVYQLSFLKFMLFKKIQSVTLHPFIVDTLTNKYGAY